MYRSLLIVPLIVATTISASTARAQGTPAHAAIRNVVLVHGAFADGSSYARVIPLLEAQGLRITAVQNPLTSLANDAAATRRAIALQDGPVVLATAYTFTDPRKPLAA